LKVGARGLPRFNTVLDRLRAREDFDRLDMPALLNELIADGAAVEVQYVHGHWRGVNDFDDLRQAVDFAHDQSQLGTTPPARD
jgi:phosphoenolpyruvate phosphomutase